MIAISVRTDIEKLARHLDEHAAKQMPYAIARALTETAKVASQAITKDLPKIFDRPTPFTLRALRFEAATKANLQSVVALKDKQAAYLRLEETGGVRTPENAKALLLPNAIPLDAYGNIPRGGLARIRAEARRDQVRRDTLGFKLRREKRKSGKSGFSEKPNVPAGPRDSGVFFLPASAPANKARVGGYFRRLPGGKVQRLTGFEPSARYHPRFKFHARVEAQAREAFPPLIRKWLAEALRTAH